MTFVVVSIIDSLEDIEFQFWLLPSFHFIPLGRKFSMNKKSAFYEWKEIETFVRVRASKM